MTKTFISITMPALAGLSFIMNSTQTAQSIRSAAVHKEIKHFPHHLFIFRVMGTTVSAAFKRGYEYLAPMTASMLPKGLELGLIQGVARVWSPTPL